MLRIGLLLAERLVKCCNSRENPKTHEDNRHDGPMPSVTGSSRGLKYTHQMTPQH